MKFIIVGDSKAHAQAMIRWKKWDAEKCLTLAYGDPVPEKHAGIFMIRPLAGPKDWHFAWIVGMLKPTEEALKSLADTWGAELKPKSKRKPAKPQLLLPPPSNFVV